MWTLILHNKKTQVSNLKKNEIQIKTVLLFRKTLIFHKNICLQSVFFCMQVVPLLGQLAYVKLSTPLELCYASGFTGII